MGAGNIGEDAMNDDLVKWLRWWGAVGEEPKLSEAADRIEKLEDERDNAKYLLNQYFQLSREASDESDARIEKLEAVTKDDAKWLAAYHKWCEMNGCAPSSSDLISARKALEGKDD